MQTFLESEKKRQISIKPVLYSIAACRDGVFMGKPRPFCLHEDHSDENLLPAVRADAIAYFRERTIPWHTGVGMNPSNHLCSSQVACVNTLFPLARDAKLLAAVFRSFLPQIRDVLPFNTDGKLPDGTAPALAFEWIGTQNYLGEKRSRSRGANATSADFAFRFRRWDGRIELVLGEWKYTEAYSTPLPSPDKLNATRLETYRSAWKRWHKRQSDLPSYESFFSEPFYQLMRLTLLALEMETKLGDKPQELDADIVSIVHVAPAANRNFARSLTSPPLAALGTTVGQIWDRIAPDGRFVRVASESLLTVIDQVASPELGQWREALLRRYDWWRH